MSYELSFSPEFFFDDHCGSESDRPTTVYQAIISLAILTPNRWRAMCEEVFPGVDSDHVDYDMVMEKIRETNACRDLRSPVEVYIDSAGWHSVKVY